MSTGRRGGRRIIVALAAAALAIAGTASLGFWQLRRAAAKESLQRSIDAAASAPATAPTADEMREPAPLVHRHLRLTGRWRPDAAIYLDNRPHLGRAGFYVLMPLHVDAPVSVDIVVDRGWTPRDANDRTRIAPYATPAGDVVVTGIAMADEPRLLDLARPGDRRLKGVWQNLDFDAYVRLTNRPTWPLVIRQDAPAAAPSNSGSGSSSDPAAAEPASDGLLRDWPDRGEVLQGQIDRHHGYAFQWFALAATLVALVVLQVVRLARPRRNAPS